jgi:hypothetical protein
VAAPAWGQERAVQAEAQVRVLGLVQAQAQAQVQVPARVRAVAPQVAVQGRVPAELKSTVARSPSCARVQSRA